MYQSLDVATWRAILQAQRHVVTVPEDEFATGCRCTELAPLPRRCPLWRGFSKRWPIRAAAPRRDDATLRAARALAIANIQRGDASLPKVPPVSE